MPNLGSALKDEITRLAKKTIKQAIGPLQSASAKHRGDIAQLKRALLAVERELRTTRKQLPAKVSAPADDAAGPSHLRFQAKGLRTLRARLGLSAADFGRLVGVSGQTIYNWESEKATPRRNQIASIAVLRGLGKRAAAQKLAALSD